MGNGLGLSTLIGAAGIKGDPQYEMAWLRDPDLDKEHVRHRTAIRGGLRGSDLDKDQFRRVGSPNGLLSPRVGGTSPVHAETNGSGKIRETPGGFISVSCADVDLVAIEMEGIEAVLMDMATVDIVPSDMGVVALDIAPVDVGVPASVVRMQTIKVQARNTTNGM